MRSYTQAGNDLTVPASAAVVAGDGVVINQLFGVAAYTAAAGADVVIQATGCFVIPKVSALAIAIGEAVYWDNTAKVVTKTATGNLKIGVAISAAANPSGTVEVRLNGSF